MFVRLFNICLAAWPGRSLEQGSRFHASNLSRLAACAVMAHGLAACSAISIPLGDVFGRTSQARSADTVASVPVTAVTSQPLAPLPRPGNGADADPITTGSIARPASSANPQTSAAPSAIPYQQNVSGLGGTSGSLASSGLAAIPPDKAAPSLISTDDLPVVTATLAGAFLDQESAATLPWLNNSNGHGGLIVPVGAPARQAGQICRAVVISVQSKGQASDWIQANACRDNDAPWQLQAQRNWRNPA